MSLHLLLRSLNLAVLISAILPAVVPVQTIAGQPNILLVVTDDQRSDTIQALGNQHIRTPTLDRLVREGTAFSRAVTAIPICVASRAELLTGRDGRFNGHQDFGFSVASGVPHLATILQNAGYETCYVGKWHTAGRPSSHGYLRTEGLYAGGDGTRPLTEPVDWKGMPVTGYSGWVFQNDAGQSFPELGIGLTRNISEIIADSALRFLQTRSESKPFFLHINFTAPHDPLLIPRGFEQRTSSRRVPLPGNFLTEHPFDHGNAGGRDELLFSLPRTREQTQGALAVYYSVIEHMDSQLGRILQELDRRELRENTLVVFTSDHGLAIGSHGLRGKQNMYEHTVGVPLLWRGPGIPAGAKLPTQCYLRDLFPTLCDFAGIPIPATVHGRSLKPVLDGRQLSIYDVVYCHFRDSQRMVRTERWKLVHYPLAGREQLFYVQSDPLELTNVIEEPAHREQLVHLRRLLGEWLALAGNSP